MKRNALIRIILWSGVLILLTALVFGILFNPIRLRPSAAQDLTEATYAPRPITARLVLPESIVVRSMPSPEAPVERIVDAGQTVEIHKTESVNGTEWAYLLSPAEGWAEAASLYPANNEPESTYAATSPAESVPEYTSVTEIIPEETIAAPAAPQSSGLIFDPADIRELEIEWHAGNILIQASDSPVITISETGADSSDHAMTVQREGKSLSVEFMRENRGSLFSTVPSKALTISVPKDWFCHSLEIETASADVLLNALTLHQMEFDGASGTLVFDNCTVDSLDMDTASGDIHFLGTLKDLECEAASANVTAVFQNVPNRLSMESMSGNLDLTLPENAGFTLNMESMHQDFFTDFQDVTLRDGQYRRGDGSCRIHLGALSGQVQIRRAS